MSKAALSGTSCHPTAATAELPPSGKKTNTRARLTGPALDAPLGAGHGEDGEAVVVLGAASLDGAHVAVAASPEHSGKIQRLHGLGLHLPEHGLTHRLKLAVQGFAELSDGMTEGEELNEAT